MELRKIQNHIIERLGNLSFVFTYEQDTVNFLTDAGTSLKYGARELKRILDRHILNPLADDFVDGKISSGNLVKCKVIDDHIGWDIIDVTPEQTFEESEEYVSAA